MRASVNLAWRRSIPWIALAIISAAILSYQLQLSFDLSAFLPKKTSLAHEVLLKQFRSGPGSRLIVIGINGADKATLAETSDKLRQTLGELPYFLSVSNGEMSEDSVALPEPINSYFLVMRNIDFGKEALRTAVQERLQDLAFGGGAAMLSLVSRDPFLVSLDVLERLTPFDTSGELWFAKDGSAVLMAESQAPAIDIAAQTEAIAAIQSAFNEISGNEDLSLEITGVGAFSVELQHTIRAEAQKLSVLASVAILLVLLVVYRSPRYLLLVALPLGMGFLVGLTAVSVAFDSVHGVTLAFGFTLLGVAIDYPLHLFSHSRDGGSSSAIHRIWPTLRLGAISTAVAYLALAFSASEGLAQLGVFSASGVMVAVLVTRFWLPFLIPDNAIESRSEQVADLHALPVFLPAIIVLVLVVMAANITLGDKLWDDNPASLSPVPSERLLVDRQLRSATGSADMRYLIILQDESLDGLLKKSEQLDVFLSAAANKGMIEDWQSVSNMIPSSAVLQSRLASIPDVDVLQMSIDESIANTPFRMDAFNPFVEAAGAVKTMPTLSMERFFNSPLQSWLDAHLVKIGATWVSLISLSKPDAEGLEAGLNEQSNGAELLDMQHSSVTLMQDYRSNAVGAVSIATLLIFGLLWMQRRDLRQVLWILFTVFVALAVTILLVAAVHGKLTVIHLVALLLVMGLGLDYALFLSRQESSGARNATVQAVTACAVSTTLAFAILAASSIPVLKFLGLTVATGSAACYLLAMAGSRFRAKKPS